MDRTTTENAGWGRHDETKTIASKSVQMNEDNGDSFMLRVVSLIRFSERFCPKRAILPLGHSFDKCSNNKKVARTGYNDQIHGRSVGSASIPRCC
jgi:hypothetical protein